MLDPLAQIIGLSGLPPGSLAPLLTLIWVVLGMIAGATMQRRLRLRLLPAALATGVPLLGWLTYLWGLLPGLAGLAIGALVLTSLRRPEDRVAGVER